MNSLPRLPLETPHCTVSFRTLQNPPVPSSLTPKPVPSEMTTPAKRCRIGNSKEAGVISQLPPKEPEPSDHLLHADGAAFENATKPLPEKEQPRPVILTVSSPEIVSAETPAQVDQFLDVCNFCRKKLSHNADVFMYGHFGAFCSKVCRFQQIYKDKVAEQALVKSTRTAVNSVKSNVVNG